ncbi:hypothetical protein MKW98_006441 [Papaver atlanticum]|uniref:Uncharacterized protein n=1 Tax=Papaver atlanticum TaxID=357466 RepID=A0AAD4SFY3_9MAGN|nr:hypothetical protein MKW98_006441 [Papaver atlanticum]
MRSNNTIWVIAMKFYYRVLRSGVAPLGKDTMEECARNLPEATIIEGYGITETWGIVSFESRYEGVRTPA